MHWRRRGIAVLVAAAIVAAGVGSFLLVVTGAPRMRQRHVPSGLAETPGGGSLFSVTANSILDNGVPYLPRGVTIFGIAGPDWRHGESQDLQQIRAIARFWRGNTVRIQVSPLLLGSSGNAYMGAIRNEVSAAQGDGLTAIISAQYQRTGRISGPDGSTVAFWRAVAPLYASDRHVWFDLFNEPTEGTDPKAAGVPTTENWNTWKYGGDGYVGMQTLTDDVRAVAPDNLILAEGLKGAKTLENIGGDLLTGNDVVYSVHPYFGPTNNSPDAWDANWGDLTGRIPIVIGEWGEYETNRSSCVQNAPTLVPAFMDYVMSHHVGLIAWALQPGNMIRGSNLHDPTAFDPGVPFRCSPDPTDLAAQGAGSEIRALFAHLRGVHA